MAWEYEDSILKHGDYDVTTYAIKKISEDTEYIQICYDNVEAFGKLVPARAVSNMWNLSLVCGEMSANVDTLHVWADCGGQDLLYLLGFMDNALPEFRKDSCRIAEPEQKVLIVLAVAVFLFERSDIRKRLKPETYGDLLLYCYDNKMNLEGAERDKAIELWLDFCMNDDSQAWFDVKTVSEETFERKRENEISSINPGTATEELRSRMQTWLLRWYNIKKAADLSFGNSGRERGMKRAFLYGPEALGALVLLYTIACSGRLPDALRIFPYNANVSRCFIKLLYIGFIAAAIAQVIPWKRIQSKIIQAIGWKLTQSKGSKPAQVKNGGGRMQILLPRLAACIIVGYFALMNVDTSEVVNQPPWTFASAVSFLLPLAAAFLYVFIEVGRKPGISMTAPKAGRIVLRGLAYAVLIGVVMQDIFGSALLKGAALPGFEGVVGTVQAKEIWYLSPMALFIGLFLQLLWDDKSLTDRITEGM